MLLLLATRRGLRPHKLADMTKRTVSYHASSPNPDLVDWVARRLGPVAFPDAGERSRVTGEADAVEAIALLTVMVDAWLRDDHEGLRPPRCNDDYRLIVPWGHVAEFHHTHMHHHGLDLGHTCPETLHDVRYRFRLEHHEHWKVLYVEEVSCVDYLQLPARVGGKRIVVEYQHLCGGSDDWCIASVIRGPLFHHPGVSCRECK